MTQSCNLRRDSAGSSSPDSGALPLPWSGDAFTAEVAPHLHLLLRTATRLMRDEQAAEDLLQDTLERAFVHFRRYEPGTNMRAWLLRIMNNLRISGYRHFARRPQADSLDEVEEFSLYRAVRQEGIAPADVESLVLNRVGEESILHAIDRLPEDFRMVVVLADVEGFSYKDMAAILDIPIGTVTSRLDFAEWPLMAKMTDWVIDLHMGILFGLVNQLAHRALQKLTQEMDESSTDEDH